MGKLEESTGGAASGLEEQRAFKPSLEEADALGVLPNTLHPVGKPVEEDFGEVVASHPPWKSK